MLIAQLLLIVFAGLCLIINKMAATKKSQIVAQVAKKIALSAILFNTANLAFSCGLMVQPSKFEVGIIVVAWILVILQVSYLLYAYTNYWGINKSFDILKTRFRVYFIYAFLGRYAICFCNSILKNELQINLYVTVGIQAALALCLTIQRPFKKIWMNVFSLIN